MLLKVGQITGIPIYNLLLLSTELNYNRTLIAIINAVVSIDVLILILLPDFGKNKRNAHKNSKG